MNMKKLIKGFSLVEVMLLLMIVSLFIAAGMTVISKRHMKVPKVATHGAFMCYWDGDKLVQEKYVGSGLIKKVDRQEVTDHCTFTPPYKVPYLQIQAVAGGGAGGASGYDGPKRIQHTSKTEYISPFGITDDFLKLKGISKRELKEYGGKLYAYAQADGDFGDAGDGGNIWYLKRDCGEDACIVNREWKYIPYLAGANKKKKCDCDSSIPISYQVESCEYNYKYTETETCHGPVCDHCYYGYENKGVKCSEGDEGCVCDEHKNCTRDECSLGTNDVEKSEPKTCVNFYNEPFDATCQPVEGNVQVKPTYTYPKDFNFNNPEVAPPSPRMIKHDVPLELQFDSRKKERTVYRDESKTYTICNYGNTTKFQKTDGIFGSFIVGKDPDAPDCDAENIRLAYGEDLYPLQAGSTSILENIVELKSGQVYKEKIMYEPTEEHDFPYGETCRLDASGGDETCPDAKYNTKTTLSSFTNPVTGTVSNKYEQLPNSCDYDGNQDYYVLDNKGCEGLDIISCGPKEIEFKDVVPHCSCVNDNAPLTGNSCIYTYQEFLDDNFYDLDEAYEYCQFYPVKEEGGKGGKGTHCYTDEVSAGTNITYKGVSSVKPGIRGSDFVPPALKEYKVFYDWSKWKAQAEYTAQNGTDSQGKAEIVIDANGIKYGCIANDQAPTKGTGAMKCGKKSVEDDGSKVIPGTDATVSVIQQCKGKTETKTPYFGDGKAKNLGHSNITGPIKKCGDNHVGYCLKRNASAATNGEENGRYTYNYTWNTDFLKYGRGGKAGEYKVMIIRAIKDKAITMSVGRGGTVNNASCTTNNGGDTIVNGLITAKGGEGGEACIATPTEQLPIFQEGGTFVKGKAGTPGEAPDTSNLKSNIMNLVLPTTESNKLAQWIKQAGHGGNGGGSVNRCWASEWERQFEGQKLQEATGGYLDARDLEERGCRKGTYWQATPATSGTDGAVLIRW